MFPGKDCEWEVLFVEEFEILHYRFKRDGKGSEGMDRSPPSGQARLHSKDGPPEDEVGASHQSRLGCGNERSCELGMEPRECQTAEGVEKSFPAAFFSPEDEA